MKKNLSVSTVAIVLLVTMGIVFAALYRLSEAPKADRIGPSFGAPGKAETKDKPRESSQPAAVGAETVKTEKPAAKNQGAAPEK